MLIELLFGIIFFVLPLMGMFATLILGERKLPGREAKSVKYVCEGVPQKAAVCLEEAPVYNLHAIHKMYTREYLFKTWFLDTS